MVLEKGDTTYTQREERCYGVYERFQTLFQPLYFNIVKSL